MLAKENSGAARVKGEDRLLRETFSWIDVSRRMASEASAATALATASPVLCPSCGEHFRKPPSKSAPMTLACHHNICLECFDAVELATTTGDVRCPLCSGPAGTASLNRGLAIYAEEVYVALRKAAGEAVEADDILAEGLDVPAVFRVPLTNCREHVEQQLEYFCLKEMKALCGECLPGHAGHEVKHSQRDAAFLADKLRELVARCRVQSQALAAKSARINAAKDAMQRRADKSAVEFQESVTKLRGALVERRDQLIAEANAACEVYRKVLAAHAAEMGEAATEAKAAVAGVDAAKASGVPSQMAAAMDTASRVKKAVDTVEPVPRAPTVVDIVVNKDAIIQAINDCLRVRQLKVDGDGFVVAGQGLQHYKAGNDDAARAQNVVSVTIKDTQGVGIEDLFESDVGLRATATGAGAGAATVDVPLTVLNAEVAGGGRIDISYAVPAGENRDLTLTVLAFDEPIDIVGPYTVTCVH